MIRLKFITLFLLIILSFSTLLSQNNAFEKELYIGFGGGGVMSSIDFVPSIMQNKKTGFHSGVSAKYISEKHLGLLLELNYVQRGWLENFEENDIFSYSKTLNYLEIPFMTHVVFGNKIRFVFNAGPQIGFLLNGTDKMSDALKDFIKEVQETSDYKVGMQYINDFKKFDYGIVGGAGIEIKSGVGNIQLEGRYYFGLGDIFESRKSKDNFYFNRSAHRLIEIKLSYYFKLKQAVLFGQ